MVKVKYSALYTDNLGCEQADIYFSKEGLQLNVRDCVFYNDNFNFDFYSNNPNKVGQFFYLKDDELIEYVIDIKIPLILTYNAQECTNEFILSIQRHKNYYNNSLSIHLQENVYKVEGYDLRELLQKMKEELPTEYIIDCSFLSLFGVNYIETSKENNLYCSKNLEEAITVLNKKDFCLNLFNLKNQKNLKKLQKIPITYIFNEYCLS